MRFCWLRDILLSITSKYSLVDWCGPSRCPKDVAKCWRWPPMGRCLQTTQSVPRRRGEARAVWLTTTSPSIQTMAKTAPVLQNSHQQEQGGVKPARQRTLYTLQINRQPLITQWGFEWVISQLTQGYEQGKKKITSYSQTHHKFI